MIFHLSINTGNAAYEGDNISHELKENLRDVATALLSGCMNGPVRDSNGNKVGNFWFEREA
jgi:hypothetical protein